MEQRKEINFEGQNVFAGIDVHLKKWDVTVMTESGIKRNFCQPPSALALLEHLKKRYPKGNYHAVYESGFSGFATYYALTELGINCMVVHAADVPTTQYERLMKTDRIDSGKLARELKDGKLKGIYVHRKENLDDRSLVRLRKTDQRLLGACKSRVKHLLHTNGVTYPDCFNSGGTHWSRRFMDWLRNDVTLLSPTRNSLEMLLEQVESIRKNLLLITRKIRMQAMNERYRADYRNLLSMPGIGPVTAMCLLTETDDINRFQNEKQFASYIGLVHICHDSGEKERNGGITFRGNKHICPLIVETSWICVRRDKEMANFYHQYCSRMESNEAIIRIARKLANRIFLVLKTGKQYKYEKC